MNFQIRWWRKSGGFRYGFFQFQNTFFGALGEHRYGYYGDKILDNQPSGVIIGLLVWRVIAEWQFDAHFTFACSLSGTPFREGCSPS
jgi:hypothetical protein